MWLYIIFKNIYSGALYTFINYDNWWSDKKKFAIVYKDVGQNTLRYWLFQERISVYYMLLLCLPCRSVARQHRGAWGGKALGRWGSESTQGWYAGLILPKAASQVLSKKTRHQHLHSGVHTGTFIVLHSAYYIVHAQLCVYSCDCYIRLLNSHHF